MQKHGWQRWLLLFGFGILLTLVTVNAWIYIRLFFTAFAAQANTPLPPQAFELPATITPVRPDNFPTPEIPGPIIITATPGITPIVPTPASPPIPQVMYPYITGITDNALQIFLRGQALGNRADVFSKVGDSITVARSFLWPIGRGAYNLGEHTDLQPVINFYSQTPARNTNSFSNTSLAAEVGWQTGAVLAPKFADETLCNAGESPLRCEYRHVRPAVALIMLGTNDVIATPPTVFERNLRAVIEITIEQGIIPVISTIPSFRNLDINDRVAALNMIIVELALEYEIPLWNYHAALAPLPKKGVSSDGVHPTVDYGHPADFIAPYLDHGMTIRNLTALQALDAVWKTVIQP